MNMAYMPSAVRYLPAALLDVFDRRILSGRTTLNERIPGIGNHIDHLTYADEKHTFLAVFPKHERGILVAQEKKFGSFFPGLYSVLGQPIGRQMHVGGAKIPTTPNPLSIQGEGRGRSVLVTNAAFDLQPDARFTVCNVSVRSPTGANVKFDYRVYLVFFLCFGASASAYNAKDLMDDQVASYFASGATAFDLERQVVAR